MRRFILLVGFLASGVFLAHAQHQSVSDTILLEEIATYGDYVKYQTGAKIESISPKQMEIVQEGGLEQLLMRFTPIYIKADASGLSTIHIRGTASDHTSVMFGGINVNSLTLGHSNLSNIASFLFDKLELQYGSSAALNGSGAIGGAIYLGQRNYWTNGVRADVKYTAGSFGEHLYGIKVYLGNGKWESATKLLKYDIKNDFKFQNPYHENRVSHPGAVEDIQHGAKVDNKGLIQEFNYLIGPNEYFKSSFWFEDSWHQVQPNMQENYSYQTTEELSNKNFRAWAEYKNENGKLKYNLGVGYVHDKQVYNTDVDQIIQTDRLISDLSLKRAISKKMEYKIGAKFKHIVPTVYSYSDSVIEYEQHLDFYLSWFYQPFPRLKTSINLRQQLVTNYNVPFTPALGVEYLMVRQSDSNLKAFFNASKSYRVPTFNDRFWGTQGDPNLDPENGFSLEAGTEYKLVKDNFTSIFRVNVFHMDIRNWIEWRNVGVWVPYNLDKVNTKGIELLTNLDFKLGQTESEFSLNYTYNPAIKHEEDRPDQQLIYTPVHMANARYMVSYKSYIFFVDGSYTGDRFYDYVIDENEIPARGSLDSYILTNCGLQCATSLQEHQVKCTFSVNNLFDKDYQNQRYYAMPGRYFRFGIALTIQTKNNN